MRTLSQWLLIGVAVMGLLASDAIGESKGHAWLNKHGTVLLAGFTHSLEKSTFDVNAYLAVGYNSFCDAGSSEKLFDLADEYKIPWFCVGSRGRTESPYAGGFLFYDEPHFRKVSSLDGSERVFRPHLSGLPGPIGLGIGGPRYKELRFLDLLPPVSAKGSWGDSSNPSYTFEQYIQDILNIWQPDILMYDHYPFREKIKPMRFYLDGQFYKAMQNMRQAALQRGIPYWAFLQAVGKVNDIAKASKSQIRLELFAGLAYGFTGFVHYWYDLPHNRNRGLVCMFFDAEAKPTDFYRNVAGAVPEVANLGRAMIHLLSTAIRYVPCPETRQLPRGTVAWNDPKHPLSLVDPYQKDIKVSGQVDNSDFIIGYFMDGLGERYFMPVNVRHDPDSKKDCSETIVIEFDFSGTGIKQLLRLNRKTGKVETIDASHPFFSSLGQGRYQLKLTLPGGTGDLFKYNTGTAFTGLDSSNSR